MIVRGNGRSVIDPHPPRESVISKESVTGLR